MSTSSHFAHTSLLGEAIRSCLATMPFIGSSFTSSQAHAPAMPKGVCDLIYATGQTISSVVGGTANLGLNAVRTTASLGLGIGSGLARITQKTTAVAGSIITGVMVYDSYVHLTGHDSFIHRMNPCGMDKSFPTFLNLIFNLLPEACTDKNFASFAQRAMNTQVLLVPVALVATAVVPYALKVLADGFSSWSKNLYPVRQKDAFEI